MKMQVYFNCLQELCENDCRYDTVLEMSISCECRREDWIELILKKKTNKHKTVCVLVFFLNI